MKDIENYLNEAKKFKKDDLAKYITNITIKEIDKWIKKNVDPVNGWSISRDEVMLILANNMLDFYGGMKKSAERALKK